MVRQEVQNLGQKIAAMGWISEAGLEASASSRNTGMKEAGHWAGIQGIRTGSSWDRQGSRAGHRVYMRLRGQPVLHQAPSKRVSEE